MLLIMNNLRDVVISSSSSASEGSPSPKRYNCQNTSPSETNNTTHEERLLAQKHRSLKRLAKEL